MNARLAQIQALLDEGWGVEDIASDRHHIAVLLRRGRARQTMLLDRQDAWDVLWGDGLEGFGEPCVVLAER